MDQRPYFSTMRYAIRVFVLAVGLILGNGCARGVHGGDPALPLSNTNGTAQTFPVSEKAALDVISNSLTAGYRGMLLSPAADEAYLVSNWHPTNGFVLFPLMGPIADIPLIGRPTKVVPYRPYFYIVTSAVDVSHTKVVVRTILANVIDGKEFGIHGGWANHERDVPPVQAEEDNLLEAISNAIVISYNPAIPLNRTNQP